MLNILLFLYIFYLYDIKYNYYLPNKLFNIYISYLHNICYN